MRGFHRVQGCVEGFWGRDPHCVLEDTQTGEKIKKLLEDQLRMNGRPAWLWLPVAENAPNTVPCTCDKNTTQSSDYKCISCHGCRFAPGYLKFLYETVFFCSAEFAGFTLAGVSVDRTKKPNRLQLTPGTAFGTIVTPDKPYANPGNDDWEVELAAYRKIAGDTVALEFSTDGGATYHPITLIAGPLFGYRGALTGFFKPAGIGTLRFRVTLTRLSGSSAESPSFEIVRARHVRSQDVNPALRLRSDYIDGQILILKTWDQEFVSREIARGRLIEAMGDRSQTAELDFFDTSIPNNTPAVALDDREAGPHPFFEYLEGIRPAERYAIYAINLDATINNILSHQSFSERRSQAGELYWYVF